jgi:hypothetical protein
MEDRSREVRLTAFAKATAVAEALRAKAEAGRYTYCDASRSITAYVIRRGTENSVAPSAAT